MGPGGPQNCLNKDRLGILSVTLPPLRLNELHERRLLWRRCTPYPTTSSKIMSALRGASVRMVFSSTQCATTIWGKILLYIKTLHEETNSCCINFLQRSTHEDDRAFCRSYYSVYGLTSKTNTLSLTTPFQTFQQKTRKLFNYQCIQHTTSAHAAYNDLQIFQSTLPLFITNRLVRTGMLLRFATSILLYF